MNITGAPGKHLFWQTTPKQSIRLTEVWLHTDAPWGPFGWWVYPNTEGKTWDGKTDMTRVAVVSADGSYLWFTGAHEHDHRAHQQGSSTRRRLRRRVPSSASTTSRPGTANGWSAPAEGALRASPGAMPRIRHSC